MNPAATTTSKVRVSSTSPNFRRPPSTSTSVARDGDGLAVSGNLTLHGVTKPVVLKVEGPTGPGRGHGSQAALRLFCHHNHQPLGLWHWRQRSANHGRRRDQAEHRSRCRKTVTPQPAHTETGPYRNRRIINRSLIESCREGTNPMAGLKLEILQERALFQPRGRGVPEPDAHLRPPASQLSPLDARLGRYLHPVQRAAHPPRSPSGGTHLRGHRRPA